MRQWPIIKGMLQRQLLENYLINVQGSLTDGYLTRAISLIVAAISDREVINQCPSEELRDCVALHFIDCFVKFLNLKG